MIEISVDGRGGGPYFEDYRNEVQPILMRSEQAVNALSAIANEHRLALFRLLVEKGEEGMAAGAIAAALGLPNSSLSFHLAHLAQAGLVRQERNGRSLIYSADYAMMNDLVAYLMANCCAGSTSCGPAVGCDPRASERTPEKESA